MTIQWTVKKEKGSLGGETNPDWVRFCIIVNQLAKEQQEE